MFFVYGRFVTEVGIGKAVMVRVAWSAMLGREYMR